MSDHDNDIDMDTLDTTEGDPVMASVVEEYSIVDSHFDQEPRGRVHLLYELGKLRRSRSDN
jgi:hypothetical protein